MALDPIFSDPPHVDAKALIADLTYRNAAYNVLYRLGFTSLTVPTFTPGAAEWWLARCAEVEAGDRSTDIHRLLAEKVPAYQLKAAVQLLREGGAR